MTSLYKNILKGILTLGLLGLLAHSSLLNFSLLSILITQPAKLVFVFSLTLLALFLCSWRWYRLNSTQNFGISYRDTLISTYIGMTFNNILPGGVSGDIIRVNYLFKRVPQKKIAGALSILTDRIIGLLGVIFSTCLIGVAYHHLFSHADFLSLFLTISSYVGLAVVIAFLLLLALPNKLNIIERLQSRFKIKKIAELLMVIKIFKKSPLILLECIAISMLIQLIIVVTIVIISRTLEFPPISSVHYAIASMVTQIMNLIPIAPGGVGVGEVAFAKTITLLNPAIPAAYATIFLAYRILNIVFCAPGILIYFKNDIFKKIKLAENSLL